MARRLITGLGVALLLYAALGFIAAAHEAPSFATSSAAPPHASLSPDARQAGAGHAATGAKAKGAHETEQVDYIGMLFVFALSTFIGIGVIARVSRLLHTPLMSLTNAISAIAVVGSILVTGSDYPTPIRFLGAVALFASMTNIVSGFLITDRMLKMFKQPTGEGKR
jgi:NAD(P) transhydrogenase subunit alpha